MSSFRSFAGSADFLLTANEDESGIIDVSIKENSYTDLVGLSGSGSNTWTISYDRENPSITNESFSVDSLTGVISYRYDFSEPVNGLLAEHIDVYEATSDHHQPWAEITSKLSQAKY